MAEGWTERSRGSQQKASTTGSMSHSAVANCMKASTACQCRGKQAPLKAYQQSQIRMSSGWERQGLHRLAWHHAVRQTIGPALPAPVQAVTASHSKPSAGKVWMVLHLISLDTASPCADEMHVVCVGHHSYLQSHRCPIRPCVCSLWS